MKVRVGETISGKGCYSAKDVLDKLIEISIDEEKAGELICQVCGHFCRSPKGCCDYDAGIDLIKAINEADCFKIEEVGE